MFTINMLATLTILALVRRHAWSALLSSSQIEKCVKIDDEENYEVSPLDCDDRLILSITLEGGSVLETEELNFTLDCVGSPDDTCPCPCNYATDPNCQCRDMEQPITVTMVKSEVFATFPLTYIKSFNYKPVEEIIIPSGSCRDGDFDEQSTCPRAYVQGELVPDSQGFCCACSLGQTWRDTFGELTDRTRANLNCQLLSNSKKSAHCFVNDELWYEGYSLSSYIVDFDVTVRTYSGSNRDTPLQSLTINPSLPHAVSDDDFVEVRLLGDLNSYSSIPQLEGNMLMIPHPEGATAEEIVTQNREKWMVLDMSQITLDGSECDKVGVGYTAFRFQAEGCNRPQHHCLSNQIADLAEEDDNRISQGLKARYYVSGYLSGGQQEIRRGANSGFALGIPVSGITNSLLRMEVAAEQFKLIVNQSTGEILNVELCKTLLRSQCDQGFEALRGSGMLFVQVKNSGAVDADFTLSVTNCSEGILPIQAEQLALAANVTVEMIFEIRSTDTGEANHTCDIILTDSLGQPTDTFDLAFAVNATQFEFKPNLNETGYFTGGNVRQIQESSSICDTLCPSFFNIICFIFSGCWSKLVRFILIVTVVFISFSLCLCCIRRGYCFAFLRAWCGFVLKPGENRHTHKRGKKSEPWREKVERWRDSNGWDDDTETSYSSRRREKDRRSKNQAKSSSIGSSRARSSPKSRDKGGSSKRKKRRPSQEYVNSSKGRKGDGRRRSEKSHRERSRGDEQKKEKAKDGGRQKERRKKRISRKERAAQFDEFSQSSDDGVLGRLEGQKVKKKKQDRSNTSDMREGMIKVAQSGYSITQNEMFELQMQDYKQARPKSNMSSPKQVYHSNESFSPSSPHHRSMQQEAHMGWVSPQGQRGQGHVSIAQQLRAGFEGMRIATEGDQEASQPRGGWVYLDVDVLGLAPLLQNAGVSACLKGQLQLVQDIEEDAASYLFIVPKIASMQLLQYNPQSSRYIPLNPPISVPKQLRSVLLSEDECEMAILRKTGTYTVVN